MCANHGCPAAASSAHSRNRSVRNAVCECFASYCVRHAGAGRRSIDERPPVVRDVDALFGRSHSSHATGVALREVAHRVEAREHAFVLAEAGIVGRGTCADRCSCRCSRTARARSRVGGRRARRCRGGRRAACRSAPSGGSSGTCRCRATPGSVRTARPARSDARNDDAIRRPAGRGWRAHHRMPGTAQGSRPATGRR